MVRMTGVVEHSAGQVRSDLGINERDVKDIRRAALKRTLARCLLSAATAILSFFAGVFAGSFVGTALSAGDPGGGSSYPYISVAVASSPMIGLKPSLFRSPKTGKSEGGGPQTGIRGLVTAGTITLAIVTFIFSFLIFAGASYVPERPAILYNVFRR
jgi:hypothetical protein